MNKLSKIIVAVVAIVALSSLISAAVASYVMNSNSVTVTVNDPIQMTLATSTTSTVSGQSIMLTAYVEDQTNGVVVSFYDNGQGCGQATTAGGGYAKLTLQPSMGTHTYTAVGLHP